MSNEPMSAYVLSINNKYFIYFFSISLTINGYLKSWNVFLYLCIEALQKWLKWIFQKYLCVRLPHYSLYLTYIIYTYSAYIAVICERLYDFYHQTSAGTGHHTRIGVSLFCKLTMSGRVENSNRKFGDLPTMCLW